MLQKKKWLSWTQCKEGCLNSFGRWLHIFWKESYWVPIVGKMGWELCRYKDSNLWEISKQGKIENEKELQFKAACIKCLRISHEISVTLLLSAKARSLSLSKTMFHWLLSTKNLPGGFIIPLVLSPQYAKPLPHLQALKGNTAFLI